MRVTKAMHKEASDLGCTDTHLEDKRISLIL